MDRTFLGMAWCGLGGSRAPGLVFEIVPRLGELSQAEVADLKATTT